MKIHNGSRIHRLFAWKEHEHHQSLWIRLKIEVELRERKSLGWLKEKRQRERKWWKSKRFGGVRWKVRQWATIESSRGGSCVIPGKNGRPQKDWPRRLNARGEKSHSAGRFSDARRWRSPEFSAGHRLDDEVLPRDCDAQSTRLTLQDGLTLRDGLAPGLAQVANAQTNKYIYIYLENLGISVHSREWVWWKAIGTIKDHILIYSRTCEEAIDTQRVEQ